jgi:uncharacterized membrane protein
MFSSLIDNGFYTNPFTRMKAIIGLIVVGSLFGIYGYWGAFTESGRTRYDEMDAMYPFFIGFGAMTLCWLIAIVLCIVKYLQRLKRKDSLRDQ